jgi:transcription-repair coupling factor (superfamily II helicase)
MAELKETDFAELFHEEIEKRPFVRDCQIDTDLEILLPTDYVNSVQERLHLYKELDSIEDETKLQAYEQELRDRFGPLPPQAIELISTMRLRWAAEQLGFEKILLKNKRMIGHFVSNPTSPFYSSPVFAKIMNFVKDNDRRCKLRQEGSKLMLSIQNVSSSEDGLKVLNEMM